MDKGDLSRASKVSTEFPTTKCFKHVHCFPRLILLDFEYLYQNEDTEIGVMPTRNQKKRKIIPSHKKKYILLISMNLEWEIQMVLQTQKRLFITDRHHGIKSKNTGTDNQGEGEEIQV